MTTKNIRIKNWFHKNFKKTFTVACDVSMFAYPNNTHERLFVIKGLWRAKRFARKWVWDHSSGQARVLEGAYQWINDKAVKVAD